MAEFRRGREHDAEGTRAAILYAAEEVFAQHGFDGARIDAIAARAGYNKSLIFHYFSDKLGLYTAVVARMIDESDYLTNEALHIYNDASVYGAAWLRSFLEMMVRGAFAYMLAHPKSLRIITWEAAENWQTFKQVMAKLDLSRLEAIRRILAKIQDSDLLRPGLDPTMMFSIIISVCHSYLTSLPRYKLIFKEEDFTSSAALQRACEQIVTFVVRGSMRPER
ncbi:MAG TPA: TetR family transcriptional regulator [Ktedonobacteraceae bacterium]|nr:TetR family transcriptional regulator [Ktedonobacteraceae bacterium]HEV2662996.1 TetR family transcriptional regulator [Ktedonobacteraceae bacterium]